MKIRAAIARSGEPFTIEECELASPRRRELRVKVEACGVCHTDLSARAHGLGTPLPAVLGHEGVGRIDRIGDDVTGFEVGDRVVMSFGACGDCPSCSQRAPAYCRHALDFNVFGRRVDGSSPITLREQSITGHFFGQSAFATHAIVAARNVVKLPEDVASPLMTSLGCGVQTGMGAVVNVLAVTPEDSIAIFGCGTVGLAAVMAARIAGCTRIVAVDLDDRRLVLARELGATHTVNNTHGAADAALAQLGGLTCAFDNTGVTSVIELAFRALGARGRVALAGLSPKGAKIQLDANRLMSSGRTLRGTVEGDANPPEFIPRMIDWYRQGLLPLERLVTVYPFERINDAVADMAAGHVVKPVLRMAPS